MPVKLKQSSFGNKLRLKMIRQQHNKHIQRNSAVAKQQPIVLLIYSSNGSLLMMLFLYDQYAAQLLGVQGWCRELKVVKSCCQGALPIHQFGHFSCRMYRLATTVGQKSLGTGGVSITVLMVSFRFNANLCIISTHIIFRTTKNKYDILRAQARLVQDF